MATFYTNDMHVCVMDTVYNPVDVDITPVLSQVRLYMPVVSSPASPTCDDKFGDLAYTEPGIGVPPVFRVNNIGTLAERNFLMGFTSLYNDPAYAMHGPAVYLGVSSSVINRSTSYFSGNVSNDEKRQAVIWSEPYDDGSHNTSIYNTNEIRIHVPRGIDAISWAVMDTDDIDGTTDVVYALGPIAMSATMVPSYLVFVPGSLTIVLSAGNETNTYGTSLRAGRAMALNWMFRGIPHAGPTLYGALELSIPPKTDYADMNEKSEVSYRRIPLTFTYETYQGHQHLHVASTLSWTNDMYMTGVNYINICSGSVRSVQDALWHWFHHGFVPANDNPISIGTGMTLSFMEYIP